MSQLAAPVEDNDFNFVASIKKAGDFLEFDPEVMVAYLEPEAHLLYFETLGVSFALLELLRLLVVVFTPIDNFCYRRICIGRNFHQIKFAVAG